MLPASAPPRSACSRWCRPRSSACGWKTEWLRAGSHARCWRAARRSRRSTTRTAAPPPARAASGGGGYSSLCLKRPELAPEGCYAAGDGWLQSMQRRRSIKSIAEGRPAEGHPTSLNSARPRTFRPQPSSVSLIPVARIELIHHPQVSRPIGRTAAGVVGLVLHRDLLANRGGNLDEFAAGRLHVELDGRRR